MTFGLYELSFQPDLQTKLRDEIKETLVACNGELTYDNVQEMVYLNMVVQGNFIFVGLGNTFKMVLLSEMLRMYPPLPFLDRKCTDRNGYSLEPYDNFIIPYNMPIMIPAFSIQRDPKVILCFI